ncbi:hypothetical protein SEPCBS57363_003805 [Sporothrix epigloea]|uniref:Btz domain-containing protein n=1 Tax=Sporothrix epigloea TaxID=1892477 RepID=A0ABP0DNR7_9PEZI
MATLTAAPTLHETHKRNTHRRRQVIGRRRRVGGDDTSDKGVQDAHDLGNSDSLSDESIASDGGGTSNGSNISNIDEMPPAAPVPNKSKGSLQQAVVCSSKSTAAPSPRTQTEVANNPPDTVSKPQTSLPTPGEAKPTITAPRAAQPAIVSSSAAPPPRRETAYERQRREHDLYKQRRDEDPSFVPNRGAFFMHDHRGAGPAANGFRPFNRSGRGSRGRGSFGGSYLPMQ